MALLNCQGKVIRWLRGAKAKHEGTNYGPSWIHWEAPKIRSNDRRLLTPVDHANKELAEKRKWDLVMGKFK